MSYPTPPQSALALVDALHAYLKPCGLALVLSVLSGCLSLPAGDERALQGSSASRLETGSPGEAAAGLSLDQLEPTGAGQAPEEPFKVVRTQKSRSPGTAIDPPVPSGAHQTALVQREVSPAATGAGAGPVISGGSSLGIAGKGSVKTVVEAHPAPSTSAPQSVQGVAAPVATEDKPPADSDLARFQVVLTADQLISEAAQGKGELRVWIGDKSYTPQASAGTVQGNAEIVARSNTAKVTPFAPNFDIDPKEGKCITIDPTGSEARFTLTAKESGEFKVGATVELFAKADCTGPSIPKSAATVSVKVDVKGQFEKDLEKSTLDGLLGFWKELLALAFGSVMFLLRNVLKERFGINMEKQAAAGDSTKNSQQPTNK